MIIFIWCIYGLFQSYLDLKNYEAVFSIVAGLESDYIQRVVDSWQIRLLETIIVAKLILKISILNIESGML